jgi:hypothetical protein
MRPHRGALLPLGHRRRPRRRAVPEKPNDLCRLITAERDGVPRGAISSSRKPKVICASSTSVRAFGFGARALAHHSLPNGGKPDPPTCWAKYALSLAR